RLKADNTVRVNQIVTFFLIESSIHLLDQNRYLVDTGLIQLESRKSPTAELFEVFSTWMAFGGNTRDLGSFRKETDKITDLHQIHEEVLFIERGDSVAGIKQRHRDLSNDGVRDLAMASGLQRDAVTTISLYIQNRF
ncbi:hypothetical protein Tco_0218858, partial [Tanacetum coccineum]